MRRDLLIGVAVGAGLSSAAYVVAGQLKPAPAPPPRSAKIRLYELAYERPNSPTLADFKGIPDPLSAALPSQGLAELAADCGVREYKLDARDKVAHGLNSGAYLWMDPSKLSDQTFNCLSERVRPPYLALHVVERCRSLIDHNPANPPCREPIP